MKYVAGRKFKISGIDLDIEVNGCFPGGQGRSIRWMQNSYQITMNGIPMEITEQGLETLENAMHEIAIVETDGPVNSQEPLVEKKKRGRPRK